MDDTIVLTHREYAALQERAERAEAERDAAADLLERLLTDRPEHGNGLNYSAVMDARAFLGRVETQNETTQPQVLTMNPVLPEEF